MPTVILQYMAQVDRLSAIRWRCFQFAACKGLPKRRCFLNSLCFLFFRWLVFLSLPFCGEMVQKCHRLFRLCSLPPIFLDGTTDTAYTLGASAPCAAQWFRKVFISPGDVPMTVSTVHHSPTTVYTLNRHVDDSIYTVGEIEHYQPTLSTTCTHHALELRNRMLTCGMLRRKLYRVHTHQSSERLKKLRCICS